ncbi:CLUMA_CG017028, isoform A [Clunio marinus]|uniref:CLUMA_CG017028, isoform A n=1 Tax=Clunio marinus TaxID=568069 RepID=A0A1J1IZ88_9DIPT|nr:CLUMA_CG017028, isoform A [Clunio marinus]
MNWKLLLIAVSLIAGISARPADDSKSETSTVNMTPEASTLVTEKITTTTPLAESTTKRQPKLPEVVTTTATPSTKAAKTEEVSTVRYLVASLPHKPTNPRRKYNNNYANLITKHTLNNNRNVSNWNNSNEYVSVHGFVVDSSLPVEVVVHSEANSKTSSTPLTLSYVDPTITTKRAFVTSNYAVPTDAWSNYSIEKPKVVPTKSRKPVIHKVISKWSDNPSDVLKFHRNNLVRTTQATEVNNLKNKLSNSPFNPSVFKDTFDQLPAIIGQQLITHGAKLKPTTSPHKSTVMNIVKRPNSPELMCKRLKIKLTNSGELSNESNERCDFNLDNKVETYTVQTTTSFYEFPKNDKFHDVSESSDDYESDEKQESFEVVAPDTPQIITSIAQMANKPLGVLTGSNQKLRKKKKPGSAFQIDEGDVKLPDDASDYGSIIMTVMAIMAIFNPMNFGVWGLVMAPLAAMLFGGMFFGMHKYMNKDDQYHQSIWPKPQEIIIKNKIKHSPLPIRITHLHKNLSPPPKSIPLNSYGPPISPYQKPSSQLSSYGEPPYDDSYYPQHQPVMMDSYHPQPDMTDSYHPQPVMIDTYQPQKPPSKGPYNRKTNLRLKRPKKQRTVVKLPKRKYKFKLL